MKFVKLIIFISLIVLSLQRTDRKIKKTVSKSSLKYKWQPDYLCDILIDGKSQGKGTFTQPPLETPGSDLEKIGMVWKMTEGPIEILQRSLIAMAAPTYYFPYRYVDLKTITYTNNGGVKTISFRTNNDSGDNFETKINLPTKKFGVYITDVEATQVKDWIAGLAGKNKNDVTTFKTYSVTSGNLLVDQLNLLAAANQGDDALKKALAQQQTSVNGLNDKINNLVKSSDQLQADVATANKALQDKKNIRKGIEDNLNAAKQQLLDLNKTLNDLKAQTTGSKTSSLQTTVNADVTNINNSASTLQGLVPRGGTAITNIKNNLAGICDTSVKTTINNFYTGN